MEKQPDESLMPDVFGGTHPYSSDEATASYYPPNSLHFQLSYPPPPGNHHPAAYARAYPPMYHPPHHTSYTGLPSSSSTASSRQMLRMVDGNYNFTPQQPMHHHPSYPPPAFHPPMMRKSTTPPLEEQSPVPTSNLQSVTQEPYPLAAKLLQQQAQSSPPENLPKAVTDEESPENLMKLVWSKNKKEPEQVFFSNGNRWLNGKEKRWLEVLERLKAYKEEFGDCIVPRGYSDDPRLASWVCAEERMFVFGLNALTTPIGCGTAEAVSATSRWQTKCYHA